MTSPYTVSNTTLSADHVPVDPPSKRPLWKAFWLLFVPSCIAANALSLMGLLYLRANVDSALFQGLTQGSPFRVGLLSWLTLAVPFLLSAPLVMWAIWHAAPAKQFRALNWAAKLVALAYFAGVAFILTQAFLRAFRGVLVV